MESGRALLTAFCVEVEKRDGEPLTPARAEAIAVTLGYGEKEIFELAERLRKEELLDIRWGGIVALTEKGLDFLKPPQSSGPIIDAWSIYAPNATKVLGQGATDNSISDVNTGGGHFIVGDNIKVDAEKTFAQRQDKAQVLNLFQQIVDQLDESQKAQGAELRQLVEGITASLARGSSPPGKSHLADDVKKANGLLAQLIKGAQQASVLWPYLQRAGTWLGVTAASLL
jgi:hypothetical protein